MPEGFTPVRSVLAGFVAREAGNTVQGVLRGSFTVGGKYGNKKVHRIALTAGETTVVPLGPLHITSDEPGHFRLFVDGEDIVDADYRMFYVHRGMEKLAETRMGYNEVTFLADRVCGICGYAHSVAYATSVENALGVLVPQRAHAIRSLMLETERLHSHMLNLGLVCHFTGFDSGFMQFFRAREKAMTLAELLTGGRKTYAINLIGGVRRDILAEQRTRTLQLVGELREEVQRLLDILLATPNFGPRVGGVGGLIGYSNYVHISNSHASATFLSIAARMIASCSVRVSRTLPCLARAIRR